MKKEFSKEYILKNMDCYKIKQVEALSFINQESIKIEDIINSEMSLRDKGWFLVRKCELTIKEKAELAYKLASVVLPIFEAKRPGDNRVKECLEAIQQFNLGKITRYQLMIKRYAAYTADDASAYATDDASAYAAYAASTAAYTADYATSTAACATDDTYTYATSTAAAIAAAADAAAYTDDAYQSLIIQTMLQFVKNH